MINFAVNATAIEIKHADITIDTNCGVMLSLFIFLSLF